jgi:IS4 transposase
VKILDLLVFDPGAFYIMDRGYLDFTRLYSMHLSSSFFITRAKKNYQFARRYSRPVDKTTGLRCDQTIVLTGFYPKTNYPDVIRRVGYLDAETNKRFYFLTNNFIEPALTMAQLYKRRWQVELFFKWIKQHLRIKAFFGTSENAVKTQIWVAISMYVLVAIIKKRLHLDLSLYTILQILSITVFEKRPLIQVLSNFDPGNQMNENANQLLLFDL